MFIAKLEAILFAVAKPVAVSQLKKQLGVSDEVLEQAIEDIKARWNTGESGVHLLEHSGQLQFVTNSDFAEEVAVFLKKEASGPLTRPALETLAVIAYQGPVTKPEIEQVRGVNCALILRNLLIRGLIEQMQDKQRLQPAYLVSAEFLRELGALRTEELPEYDSFHNNEKIRELMAEIGQAENGV